MAGKADSSRKKSPPRKGARGVKRSPGEHIGLDRRQIVARAKALVEAHGADALNIRALAEQMGVTPAAIYWHVKSKEELFDEIVKDVFDELTPPKIEEGDWSERVRALLLWFRRRLIERGAVVAAAASSPALPFAFVHVGFTLAEMLADAGLDLDERRDATRGLMSLTVGVLLFEGSSRKQWESGGSLVDMQQAAERLGKDQLVALVQNLSQMRDFDFDAVYRYSLDRMLEGISARVPKRKK
jgi:AcrR family transcriptional regulator